MVEPGTGRIYSIIFGSQGIIEETAIVVASAARFFDYLCWVVESSGDVVPVM